MIRARRWIAAAAGIALLGGGASQAIGQADAGTARANAVRAMEREARVDGSWRNDLERALQDSPGDPDLNELAALATMRSSPPSEEVAAAEGRMRAAIEGKPGSAYAWARMAQVKYRRGDTGGDFERALINAQALGPHEPEVQAIIADYGLAVIDEVKPVTRSAVERAIEAGMKRNAAETLQIASRRGRLDVACRHLNGTTRPAATKWIQLCQSMEATS